MDPDPGGPKHVDPVDPDSDPEHCLKGCAELLQCDSLLPATASRRRGDGVVEGGGGAGQPVGLISGQVQLSHIATRLTLGQAASQLVAKRAPLGLQAGEGLLETHQEGRIGAEADKLLLDGQDLADVVLPVAHLGELLAEQFDLAGLDVDGGLGEPLADGVQLGD